MKTLRLALVIAVIGLQLVTAHAQTEDEGVVKAAFLLRFVQYVEWPPESFARPDAPLTIGVVGSEPFAAKLAQLAGERPAAGRKIVVRGVGSAADLTGVQLLFVTGREPTNVENYANAARGRRLLLVTEAPGALDHGSMINFVIRERRVRFEIAVDTAEKAGLAVSSKLLAVAVRVQRTGGAAAPQDLLAMRQ